MKSFPESIAIVRVDRLGDVIQTLPVATLIKQQSPETTVRFIVRPYTAPVVRVCPDVDEVVEVSDDKVTLLKRALKRTEAAIFPSPSLGQILAARIAGVRTTVGTGYRWYSSLLSKKIYEHRRTAERHESEYNVRMLAPLGFSTDTVPQPELVLPDSPNERVARWIAAERLQHFAVLHVVSGGSSPEWPETRWVELAHWLAHRLSLRVVLTGVETDRERLLSVAARLQEVEARLFIGKPLEELSSLLASAHLVVASSTGPGHLAAALGARTVGIFPLAQALSKERWGFRGPLVANIEPATPPRATCPACKGCDCLNFVTLEQATAAIESLENMS